MREIIRMISMALFGIIAAFDWKTQEIPIVLIGIQFVLGAILCCSGHLGFGMIADLLPGICLIGIACISGEKMGYGDGLAVMAAGLILGWEQIMISLMFALIGASVCSMLLLVFHQVKREARIPFMPFLFLGIMTSEVFGKGVI